MSYSKARSGAGWVAFVPGGSNPTPVHVAEVDTYKLSVSQDEEPLTDENGEEIDSFSKGRKLEGSISLKSITNSLLAIATDGVTVTAGRPIGYSYPAVIPATPFQVPAPLTLPTRTFVADLGVIDFTSGKQMTRGATATGAGVYAVDTATGIYTFHTADVGHSILVNYSASQATEGSSAFIAAAGTVTQSKYALHFYGGRHAAHGIYVPQARIPGLDATFTKGAWSSVELKWKATKDSNGRFLYTYFPE
jgi:hypothetical protein